MRKYYILIPAIAVLHLAASVTLLLLSAGASFAALETGSELPLLARVVSVGGKILLYPVFIPASGFLVESSGAVGWMLLIVNSLTWAVAVTYLVRVFAARRERAVLHRPVAV